MAAPNASSRCMVDPNAHTAATVGDEPLLLAKVAPCWVGADRVRSAQKRDRGRRERARSRRRPAEPGARQGPGLRRRRRRDRLRQWALRSGRSVARPGLGSAALRAGADRARRGRRGAVGDRRLGAGQAHDPRQPRARRARRRAAHRPRGRRLRRHCAAGEILRHAPPGRCADRHDARLRRPSSLTRRARSRR